MHQYIFGNLMTSFFIYALSPFSPCKLLTQKCIYLDLATFWDEINFRLLYGCFIFLSSWAISLVFSYPVWPWVANLIFVNNARFCFFSSIFVSSCIFTLVPSYHVWVWSANVEFIFVFTIAADICAADSNWYLFCISCPDPQGWNGNMLYLFRGRGPTRRIKIMNHSSKYWHRQNGPRPLWLMVTLKRAGIGMIRTTNYAYWN